jgi:hypothetical protein
MNTMRRRLALIWVGATAIVSAVVGTIAYQAGWAAGVTARLPEGAVGPYPYAYGPHFGFFGFLPFLLLLLVLFLVFRGGGRWGYRRYGPSQPQPQAPPAGDPWQGWPQRPPSERPAPPEQQEAPQ